MDLDSSRKSGLADSKQRDSQRVLGTNPTKDLSLEVGKLYVITKHGKKKLDWVEPETGEFLHLSWLQGAKPPNDFSVPLLFLKREKRHNGYSRYKFLMCEKIVQTILHEDQYINDFFAQAKA